MFLHAQDLARHFIADAGHAALGGDLAVFLEQQRAVDALAIPAAEERIGVDPGEHVLEGLGKEERFKILARFLRGLGIAMARNRGRWRRDGDGREESALVAHHITSISAWS